jgi:hypothetical protein
MKNTILAIALALAVSPFTFAAGQEAAPAGQTDATAATAKTKKHTRKVRKAKKSKTATEPATAAPVAK